MTALEHAGELAAREAERLWELDIIDPSPGSQDPRAAQSLETINAIIDRNGWGANVKYTGNGPPQWCGMTAGWCWSVAGLDPSWLPTYWASTYRLVAWARYQRWSPSSKPNDRPRDGDIRTWRSVSGVSARDVRRGDVLIVGDGTPRAGDHVTIVVGYDGAGRFDTISGNGGGAGPDGREREGISRRYYRLSAQSGYRPLWLIRPAFGDLLAERPV